MKKLVYFSALGLLLVGLSGCNRSWPSCFCNRNQSYPSMDCCETCDPCDPCSDGGFESYGGYYMPGVSDVEWAPQSAPTTIDSLPTPGPAPSST
jgi:hypothetical protein